MKNHIISFAYSFLISFSLFSQSNSLFLECQPLYETGFYVEQEIHGGQYDYLYINVHAVLPIQADSFRIKEKVNGQAFLAGWRGIPFYDNLVDPSFRQEINSIRPDPLNQLEYRMLYDPFHSSINPGQSTQDSATFLLSARINGVWYNADTLTVVTKIFPLVAQSSSSCSPAPQKILGAIGDVFQLSGGTFVYNDDIHVMGPNQGGNECILNPVSGTLISKGLSSNGSGEYIKIRTLEVQGNPIEYAMNPNITTPRYASREIIIDGINLYSGISNINPGVFINAGTPLGTMSYNGTNAIRLNSDLVEATNQTTTTTYEKIGAAFMSHWFNGNPSTTLLDANGDGEIVRFLRGPNSNNPILGDSVLYGPVDIEIELASLFPDSSVHSLLGQRLSHNFSSRSITTLFGIGDVGGTLEPKYDLSYNPDGFWFQASPRDLPFSFQPQNAISDVYNLHPSLEADNTLLPSGYNGLGVSRWFTTVFSNLTHDVVGGNNIGWDSNNCLMTDLRKGESRFYTTNYNKARHPKESEYTEGTALWNTKDLGFNVTVDNFMPFVEKVEVYASENEFRRDNFPTLGEYANNLASYFSWEIIENGNDANLKFKPLGNNGIKKVAQTDEHILIKITMSEPMTDVQIQIEPNDPGMTNLTPLPQPVALSRDRFTDYSNIWFFKIDKNQMLAANAPSLNTRYNIKVIEAVDEAGNRIDTDLSTSPSANNKVRKRNIISGQFSPPMETTNLIADDTYYFMLKACADGGGGGSNAPVGGGSGGTNGSSTAGGSGGGSGSSYSCDVYFNFEATSPTRSFPNASSLQVDFRDSIFPNAFDPNFPSGVAPYTYNWDFGDGTTFSQISPLPVNNNVSHAYIGEGVYTVSLTVTDDEGRVNTFQRQNYIVVGNPLYCDIVKNKDSITANPQINGAPQRIVTYDAVNVRGGVPPYSYEWRPTGSPSIYNTVAYLWNSPNTSSISASYQAAGTYDIALVITDSRGVSFTNHQSNFIRVIPDGSTTPFGIDFSYWTAGKNIYVTGTFNGGSNAFPTERWFFGDGSAYNGFTTQHTYASGGMYDVTYRATDPVTRETAEVTKSVYIEEDIIASFDVANPVGRGVPVPFHLGTNCNGPDLARTLRPGEYIEYNWNFAGTPLTYTDTNGSSAVYSPTHIFNTVGIKHVHLQIKKSSPFEGISYSNTFSDTIEVINSGVVFNAIQFEHTPCLTSIYTPTIEFDFTTTSGNTVDYICFATQPFDPFQPPSLSNQYTYHYRNTLVPYGAYANQLESVSNSRHNIDIVAGSNGELYPHFSKYPYNYFGFDLPTSGYPSTETIYAYVKDAAGNWSGITQEVKLFPELKSIGANYSICPGDSVRLVPNVIGGNGRYTYQWTPGVAIPTAVSPYVQPINPTTYELTVRSNDNNCTSNSADHKVNPLPLAATPAQDTFDVCLGNPSFEAASILVAGGSGNYIVDWCTDNTANPLSIGVSGCLGLALPIIAGDTGTATIHVQVIDAAGSCAPVDVYVIIRCRSTNPMVEAVVAITPTCEGDSIQLSAHQVNDPNNTGIAPYEYKWRNENQMFVSNQWNTFVSPSTTSDYTITMIDDARCVAIDTVSVVVISKPEAMNVLPLPEVHNSLEVCPGETVKLSAQVTPPNGYVYHWEGDNSATYPGTTANVNPSSRTNYELMALHPASGCRFVLDYRTINLSNDFELEITRSITGYGSAHAVSGTLGPGCAETNADDRRAGNYDWMPDCNNDPNYDPRFYFNFHLNVSGYDNGTIIWRMYRMDSDGGITKEYRDIEYLGGGSSVKFYMPYDEFNGQNLPTDQYVMVRATVRDTVCGFVKDKEIFGCLKSNFICNYCQRGFPNYELEEHTSPFNFTDKLDQDHTIRPRTNYGGSTIPVPDKLTPIGKNITTNGKMTITRNMVAHFRGSGIVRLTNGFKVQGGKFTAQIIANCSSEGAGGGQSGGGKDNEGGQEVNGGDKIGDQIVEAMEQHIELASMETTMMVYPNPSEGLINIEYSIEKEDANAQIIVNDIFGKVIHHSGNLTSNQGIYHLNLSDNASGIYLVKLFSDNNFLVMKVTLNK